MPAGPIINYPKGIIDNIIMSLGEGPAPFKTFFLKRILEIFTRRCIYAGFGNAETDRTAYLNVGINTERLWLVNPKGEIHLDNDQVTR